MLLCSTDTLNLTTLRVDTWESNSEPTLHWLTTLIQAEGLR